MSKFLLPFSEGRTSRSLFSSTGMLVSSFFLAAFVSIQNSLIYVLFILGIVVMGGIVARTRWGTVLSLISKIEVIILAWLLIIPLIYGTTVLFQISLPWGTLPVFQEGVERGLLLALRMITIILIFITTLSHMTLSEFIGALKTLQVPTAMLGSLLIMLRFIPLFMEERSQMHNAQILRGYDLGNRWQKIRSLGNLVGTTIDRAFDRSIVVYEAMALRGFGKGSMISETGVKRSDAILLVLLAVLVLSMLFLIPHLELIII